MPIYKICSKCGYTATLLEELDNFAKASRNGGSLHNHFYIDHNHETNEIRGLLCNTCNRGLGLFKDNAKLLNNAMQYLNYHNQRKSTGRKK